MYNKLIRKLIDKQYSSKANKNKDEIMEELKKVLTPEYEVKLNNMTGFLYITKKV